MMVVTIILAVAVGVVVVLAVAQRSGATANIKSIMQNGAPNPQTYNGFF